jgi:hypothetical protein
MTNLNTGSTSAIISQAASAGIDAWSGEILGMLLSLGAVGPTNTPLIVTQDTGQVTLTGTGATATTKVALPGGAHTSVGYAILSFTDALAAGTLSTTALIAGGSGYDGGSTHTYTGITATGSTSGATCTCTVTVTSGVCGNMGTIAAAGNFIAGELITIPNSSLGGSGSGAKWMASALSSGAPVVFRLDFASGAAATDPQMLITVGTGSSGSGTINGSAGSTKMTQVACFNDSAPYSTSTAYTSRYVWNPSLGYLGVCFKIGASANGTADNSIGGFVLFRTNDTSGSPTGVATVLISNSTSTTTGVSTVATGCMQCMAYSGGVSAAIYPTLNANNSTFWIAGTPTTVNNIFPFGLTSTYENGTAFVFPIFTIDPVIKFSAFNAVASNNDFPLGNTASFAVVGGTALTFISCGKMFGGAGFASWNNTLNTFCMLWQ